MDNKEQLTIKHLAPYYQFELMCVANVNGLKGKLVGMHGVDYVTLSYTVNDHNTVNDSHLLSEIKPLLRPLDLTKEIEVNGERFVPIERLAGLPGVDSLRNDIRHKNVHCDMLSYGVVQKLYEWHFAIDIPSHLYIDLNTINK